MLLFLGAGASRTFGIPDTKGFISEFEQAIGGNRIYEMLKSSVSTLDTEALMTILHDLSKPKEELLRSIAPHTARFLLERPSGVAAFIEDDDVKTTCQDLLKQVMGIMRTKCLDQVRKEKQRILDSYDTFFRSIHEQGKERGATMHYGPIKANDGSGMEYPPMAIFTTNYDTCIESYFKARQVSCDCGIVQRFGEFVLDTGSFLRATDGSPGSDNTVQLVKLHGSIDLFAKERRIRLLQGAGTSGASALTSLGEEYGSEVLIYPVESNIPGELLQSPYIELLYYFKKRLARDRTWILVGTTLRDLALASLMNDTIVEKGAGSFTVLHINPYAKEINSYLANKGFGSLAKAVQPIDGEFMCDSVSKELAARLQPRP